MRVITLMTGVMGFTFNAVGPAMPLLRTDLLIGRSLAGLHFTALAAGGLILGPSIDRIQERAGRRVVFWAAGWSLVIGGLLIGGGIHPAMTLGGALVAGLGGTGLLATGRSALADLDRAALARSIVTNDTWWSLGALLSGAVVAWLVTIGAGWRPTFLIPLLAVASLYLWRRDRAFPVPEQPPAACRRPSLPRAYWVLWAAFLPAAAGEWSTTAWVAEFMIDAYDMDVQVAALMVTSFLTAMFVGRAAGTRLTRRVGTHALMNGALALAFGGSVIASQAPVDSLAAGGLVVCGLGVALLAPLLITLCIQAAPGRTVTATARISLAASAAILTAPLALGVVADRTGIESAFGIVPLLFASCWLLYRAGRVAARRS
jgi:MFS family permease